jgi:hypothetical protein
MTIGSFLVYAKILVTIFDELVAQEKADEYKKISDAQKRQINNCFLPKSAVLATKGTSGAEKAILVCLLPSGFCAGLQYFWV